MSLAPVVQHHKRSKKGKLVHQKRLEREQRDKQQVDEWFATFSKDGASEGLSRDSVKALLTHLHPNAPPSEETLDNLIVAATAIKSSRMTLDGEKDGRVAHQKTMSLVKRYARSLEPPPTPSSSQRKLNVYEVSIATDPAAAQRPRFMSAPELDALNREVVGRREEVLACLTLQDAWRGRDGHTPPKSGRLTPPRSGRLTPPLRSGQRTPPLAETAQAASGSAQLAAGHAKGSARARAQADAERRQKTTLDLYSELRGSIRQMGASTDGAAAGQRPAQPTRPGADARRAYGPSERENAQQPSGLVRPHGGGGGGVRVSPTCTYASAPEVGALLEHDVIGTRAEVLACLLLQEAWRNPARRGLDC